MSNKLNPRDLVVRVQSHCVDDAGCWIWRGHALKGVTPVISINGRPTTVRRALFTALIGDVKPGYEVVNTCESERCCNPEHLEQVTRGERRRRDSLQRTYRMSVQQIKELRQRCAKLDMDKVRAIRASDEQGKVLAERYGVSRSLISAVRRGLAWCEPSPFDRLGARRPPPPGASVAMSASL